MKYTFQKYGDKYWAVIDNELRGIIGQYQDSGLVCVTLYKKGAEEVVKRLNKNNLPQN